VTPVNGMPLYVAAFRYVATLDVNPILQVSKLYRALRAVNDETVFSPFIARAL
jgi:hypothetical protein